MRGDDAVPTGPDAGHALRVLGALQGWLGRRIAGTARLAHRPGSHRQPRPQGLCPTALPGTRTASNSKQKPNSFPLQFYFTVPFSLSTFLSPGGTFLKGSLRDFCLHKKKRQ